MNKEEQWELAILIAKDIRSSLNDAQIDEDRAYEICGSALFKICSTLDQRLSDTFLHEIAFAVTDDVFDEGKDEVGPDGLKLFSNDEFENLICNARVILAGLSNTSTAVELNVVASKALIYIEKAESIGLLNKNHIKLKRMANHWLQRAKNA